VAAWDSSFFRKSPLFWPIATAAQALEAFADWPAPADLTAALGSANVAFEVAAPKPRRRRASELQIRYDARIATAGVVPTRLRSWHDLLNALVWASFPGAKRALHARQDRLVSARIGDDGRLPGARSAEQDAVAMIDEGGLVLLCGRGARREVDEAIARDDHDEVRALVRSGGACAVIFGHAIYEGIVCGWKEKVRAAVVVADVAALDGDPRRNVERADAALAALLARGAPIFRKELGSIQVDPRLASLTTSPS
jgi:hypothetical protein